MRVYYDRDADIGLIKSKKVLVIGYGSQGHAACCKRNLLMSWKIGFDTIKDGPSKMWPTKPRPVCAK